MSRAAEFLLENEKVTLRRQLADALAEVERLKRNVPLVLCDHAPNEPHPRDGAMAGVVSRHLCSNPRNAPQEAEPAEAAPGNVLSDTESLAAYVTEAHEALQRVNVKSGDVHAARDAVANAFYMLERRAAPVQGNASSGYHCGPPPDGRSVETHLADLNASHEDHDSSMPSPDDGADDEPRAGQNAPQEVKPAEVEPLTAAEERGWIERVAKALTEGDRDDKAARIAAVGVLDQRAEMFNYRRAKAAASDNSAFRQPTTSAAPAGVAMPPVEEPTCSCHAKRGGKHAKSCDLWNTTGTI